LKKAEEKLHLLSGLQKILLDIDKAVKIVKDTEEDALVVPNLMSGFGIDEIQAEYVAEIKLRHLNKEYILKRLAEFDKLRAEIAEMSQILGDDKLIKNIISSELKEIIKKYSQPRKTKIINAEEATKYQVEEITEEYAVTAFVTSDGYFKKITPLSLRMGGEQKLKEGDTIVTQCETTSRAELVVFTSKAQAYKARISDFEDTKASAMGEYLPAKLSFDDDEIILGSVITTDFSGYLVFCYENGKTAKIPLKAYETKTNRKKLANAFAENQKLVKIFHITDDVDILLATTNGKALVVNTALIPVKTTRNTIGVQTITLRMGGKVSSALLIADTELPTYQNLAAHTIPCAGRQIGLTR
jgi:DNA gyrase subunit A